MTAAVAKGLEAELADLAARIPDRGLAARRALTAELAELPAQHDRERAPLVAPEIRIRARWELVRADYVAVTTELIAAQQQIAAVDGRFDRRRAEIETALRRSASPQIADLRLQLVNLEDSSEGRHATGLERGESLRRATAMTAAIQRCDALQLEAHDDAGLAVELEKIRRSIVDLGVRFL